MVVRIQDIGSAVRETQYAVRGPIVARAQELEKQGKEIIYCNIGNPQSLGQKPLTWIRQVLSICEYPEILAKGGEKLFPADVVKTANFILKESKFGVGAYTESKGFKFVREAVSNFITRRDDISSDPESVYLTDGASKGVQSILRILLSAENDGIMIPIPQYPLYSATITLYGGRQVGYYLDEENNWQLSSEMLEKSLIEAKHNGTNVRAIVIINPGNPTGSVLSKANIEMVIDFASKHNLSILADEVYQENMYTNTDKFVSFSKVLVEKNITNVSLFSFHSCSKGYLGECGQRGGYFECRNVDSDVAIEITKLQSVSLCSNSVGQLVTYLMVNPPQKGEESYALYMNEYNGIMDALTRKAKILADGLNKIPGITCNTVAGSMYAFPKVQLPAGKSDNDYCMAMLEQTGICVVPGAGFGQVYGTAHFRTTILPPLEKIQSVVEKIAKFHASYK